MISGATLEELADYAAAGRIGDRVGRAHGVASRSGGVGAWVFGITVLMVFASTFHGCQWQVPVRQNRQVTVVQPPPVAMNREGPTGNAQRSSPVSPGQPSAPVETHGEAPVVPSDSQMWRDPRGYAASRAAQYAGAGANFHPTSSYVR